MFKTIQSSKRLTNSANGNPRYSVTFTDGDSFTTRPDAAWVISFGNTGYRNGDLVDIQLDTYGNISGMRRVTEEGRVMDDTDRVTISVDPAEVTQQSVNALLTYLDTRPDHEALRGALWRFVAALTEAHVEARALKRREDWQQEN